MESIKEEGRVKSINTGRVETPLKSLESIKLESVKKTVTERFYFHLSV